MSAPKSRPILFSAPMVQALLAGKKTQTRRLLKLQPPSVDAVRKIWGGASYGWMPHPERPGEFQTTGPVSALISLGWPRDPKLKAVVPMGVRSPYGAPGDVLWVRETCRAVELDNGLDGVRYLADGAVRAIENSQEASERWLDLRTYRKQRGATVPPIHMPKWASRLQLEITGLRIEPLHAITEIDACAEGVSLSRGAARPFKSCREAYAALWDTLHGNWNANPWVWVIEFDVKR